MQSNDEIYADIQSIINYNEEYLRYLNNTNFSYYKVFYTKKNFTKIVYSISKKVIKFELKNF